MEVVDIFDELKKLIPIFISYNDTITIELTILKVLPKLKQKFKNKHIFILNELKLLSFDLHIILYLLIRQYVLDNYRQQFYLKTDFIKINDLPIPNNLVILTNDHITTANNNTNNNNTNTNTNTNNTKNKNNNIIKWTSITKFLILFNTLKKRQKTYHYYNYSIKYINDEILSASLNSGNELMLHGIINNAVGLNTGYKFKSYIRPNHKNCNIFIKTMYRLCQYDISKTFMNFPILYTKLYIYTFMIMYYMLQLYNHNISFFIRILKSVYYNYYNSNLERAHILLMIRYLNANLYDSIHHIININLKANIINGIILYNDNDDGDNKTNDKIIKFLNLYPELKVNYENQYIFLKVQTLHQIIVYHCIYHRTFDIFLNCIDMMNITNKLFNIINELINRITVKYKIYNTYKLDENCLSSKYCKTYENYNIFVLLLIIAKKYPNKASSIESVLRKLQFSYYHYGKIVNAEQLKTIPLNLVLERKLEIEIISRWWLHNLYKPSSNYVKYNLKMHFLEVDKKRRHE